LLDFGRREERRRHGRRGGDGKGKELKGGAEKGDREKAKGTEKKGKRVAKAIRHIVFCLLVLMILDTVCLKCISLIQCIPRGYLQSYCTGYGRECSKIS